MCVTIHVLLCILKCFCCIWSFSFFGHPLRGFYKSMYIIAFLFLTSLLFYLKGYSETLKLTVHQVLLQIQRLWYMFLSIYINQKHKISLLKRNWKKAFQQISTTNFCAVHLKGLCLRWCSQNTEFSWLSDVLFWVSWMHFP